MPRRRGGADVGEEAIFSDKAAHLGGNYAVGIERVARIERVFDVDEGARKLRKAFRKGRRSHAPVPARGTDFSPVAKGEILKFVGEGERSSFFLDVVR